MPLFLVTIGLCAQRSGNAMLREAYILNILAAVVVANADAA
ncbi:hypothetical protein CIT292_08386 [Citrobacter youngae ATCC 29220]|uniref:Uncharacterized protein n=1 Tax=Citrobacter youngae ATCC 29220 TaxID=500640 RepID=D4BD19_9ENTR|nr:hypothetical protein CIT292_08386 [Citrobacter youngae ATCC 29220]